MADPRPPQLALTLLKPMVGGSSSERRDAFIEAHFPKRDQNGFAAMFSLVADVMSASLAVRRTFALSELFGGDVSSSPYRSCLNTQAALPAARKKTVRIDQAILEQLHLTDADASIVEMGRASWRGGRAFVLKAGLVAQGFLVPVEVSRTENEAGLPQLVMNHIERLRAGGHQVPLLSTTLDPRFTRSLLLASLKTGVEWTGRVSRHWKPPGENRWLQPVFSDPVTLAEAVHHDPRQPEKKSPGFASTKLADKLFVAYGPSPQGHYYLHRSLRAPEAARESVDALERLVVDRVKLLDYANDPLDAFAIEELGISLEKDDSYSYVTRRILLAWQFPHWRPDSENAVSLSPVASENLNVSKEAS